MTSKDLEGKIFYHGSPFKVTRINLSYCKPYKDFGPAFYLTLDKIKAYEWATQVTRKTGRGTPTVNRYIFKRADDLKIKYFSEPDIEWLDFVTLRRQEAVLNHSYDIVIGPTADAGPNLQIILGHYYLKEISAAQAIKDIKPYEIPIQFAFCTKKSVSRLVYDGEEIVTYAQTRR
mgnify:CR=1 FL=1